MRIFVANLLPQLRRGITVNLSLRRKFPTGVAWQRWNARSSPASDAVPNEDSASFYSRCHIAVGCRCSTFSPAIFGL
jgi:hypothetical protein